MKPTRKWLPGLLGIVSLTLWIAPASAAAAPPPNDNFANATVIASLPFSDTVDITAASIEPGEPVADPNQLGRTVWYSFTPAADALVTTARPITPPDMSPPTLCQLRSSQFLVIYQAAGPGFAGLTPIAGSQWSNAMADNVRVHAGTTYYFQGGQNGDLIDSGCPPFSLSLSAVPGPPNDDFADAIAFTSVPFSDSRDLTAATVEPGEPMACGTSFSQSAWYAFTPTTSGSYGSPDPGVDGVDVYTGTSLTDLTNVACSGWFGVYFWADAGTTYYLQYHGGGMRIVAVPPPAADFIYSPGNPSVFDDVTFSYWNFGYWDPTVDGWSWSFGDGTTATGASVSHRFARDGDYTVTLTVAAQGGRTSSATKTIQVRTHDVTPPVINLPAAVAIEATGSNGAVVAYTVTATDDVDPNPTVVCAPPPGSVFPLGTTTVSCTATDASGNVATGSFTITVVDTTPPTLTLPSNRVVAATGPGGAAVSYTATATDAVDPSPAVTCSPPSGTVFAIGTTTVSCTVTDSSGNSSRGSYAIKVKGAAEQLADLAAAVKGVGPGKSLAATVEIAQWFDAHGQPQLACLTLTAFDLEVRAQSGKKIPAAQAAELIADANRIKSVLGCKK